MSKEATCGRKALWHELLCEALARAGVTCGSLCGPEAPLHVAVVDPTNNGAYSVARGAEEQRIRARRPSADEPAFIAYAVVEDVHLGVSQRLEWPEAVRRGQGRGEPASLVAHAVAKASRMGVISTSRGRFGGHLVKLRHSLSGPMPLPPVVMLTILVEGDREMKLPPLPQPPPKASPSGAEVKGWFRQRGERFFAAAGRKPIQPYMFVECRNATGATESQMRRVWPGAMPPHLRRGKGERG